jgi:phospholipid/cholesterol/gamma-HCH transport system substrate-binding protein
VKAETIVGIFVLIAIGIFFYLGITIGSLRLDKDSYDFYKAFFDDTAGLEMKDPVKIAGVDVGWVSKISLIEDGKAVVIFRVRKDHKLAKNAFARVRQEGLIGNKYLELDPGDSSTGLLTPGSALGLPSAAPASVGQIMNKFDDIASSFKQVAQTLENVIASREGEDNLKQALKGFAEASDRIVGFSEVLERTLKRNEDNLNDTIHDFAAAMHAFKNKAPDLLNNLDRASGDLHSKLFPSFKATSDQLAYQTLPDFTRDFSELSRKGSSALESIDNMSLQAREGFKEAEQVMEKINNGKGLLGKIVNEEETYIDFKKTIKNIKEITGKMESMDVLIDMHSEYMIRDWNTKGYLDLKLRPSYDYFYVIQLASDEKGYISRRSTEKKRYDIAGNELTPPDTAVLWRDPYRVEETIRHKNAILFGFQFGKRFDRLAFRVGAFENTFGAGLDFYVPLNTNKVHWISSFEAFDFKGFQRLNDTRPHAKWINRFYVMKNFYSTFGFDDIFSKGNASPFFGGGIRFGDKDIKYLLASFSSGVKS